MASGPELGRLLTFLIATHLATAIVLFVFFLKDWIEIFKGLARSVRARKIIPTDTYAKLGWLLVVGTIPAGILGLVLEKPIRSLFASPLTAAGFLIVNGIVLLSAERLRRRETQRVEAVSVSSRTSSHSAQEPREPAAKATDPDVGIAAALSWKRALGIGAAQAAALVPGISRSGSSMVGGLLSGLNNENAARFSFCWPPP